jgi:predicted DNA-binding ribbon-helix-helix protein
VFLEKRSISLAGHRTSVALEVEFWAILEGMAVKQECTLPKLILAIDAERGLRPLASALRLAALNTHKG